MDSPFSNKERIYHEGYELQLQHDTRTVVGVTADCSHWSRGSWFATWPLPHRVRGGGQNW